MKTMKSRIAAMLLAATATVSAAQAITASAWETFYYTTVTQAYSQVPYNMGQTIKGWSRFSNINDGSYWNSYVTSGVMCSEGYNKTTYSNKSEGQRLYNSQGFCRLLAETFFGTKTYMEKIIYGSTAIEQGDQIRIGYRNSSDARTLFVAYVDGITYNTYTLDESTHTIKVERYRKTGTNTYYLRKLDSNGNPTGPSLYMDYLTRPVKEYDVNGDGTVSTADTAWLTTNIGDVSNYPKDVNELLSPSTYRSDVFARVAHANDWKVEYSTFYTIGYDLGHGNAGKFRYVLMSQTETDQIGK